MTDEQASATFVPSSHRKGPSTFGGLKAGAEASGIVGCGPDEPTLARPYAIATFSKILSAGTVITSRHREPKMKDMQARTYRSASKRRSAS